MVSMHVSNHPQKVVYVKDLNTLFTIVYLDLIVKNLHSSGTGGLVCRVGLKI